MVSFVYHFSVVSVWSTSEYLHDPELSDWNHYWQCKARGIHMASLSSITSTWLDRAIGPILCVSVTTTDIIIVRHCVYVYICSDSVVEFHCGL